MSSKMGSKMGSPRGPKVAIPLEREAKIQKPVLAREREALCGAGRCISRCFSERRKGRGSGGRDGGGIDRWREAGGFMLELLACFQVS